jgi:hypothetical protein
VWLSTRRSVTFCVFVSSFSGTFHETSHGLMSASSDHLPCSAWCSTASAVTGLLTEAAWKSVSSATGAVPPASFTP